MDDNEVRITLRLPVELRDDLKALADHEGRSMNSEIISRLEQTLYSDGGGAADFYAKIADAAFVRGVQIGTVEFLLANDDPVAALHEFRKQLQQPMDLGVPVPEND